MKTSGKVCGQGLSAGGHSVTSAVEPGNGLMKVGVKHWDMQIILFY